MLLNVECERLLREQIERSVRSSRLNKFQTYSAVARLSGYFHSKGLFFLQKEASKVRNSRGSFLK
jgi:hypothetical protein